MPTLVMPTADERLALIWPKIERAKKHIADLNSATRAFFDAKPYEVGTKRNPQSRKLVYYVHRADPVPLGIAVITGDITHNLRTALDYLHQHLLTVGTSSSFPSKSKDASFYIDGHSDPNHYKTSAQAKVQGLRQDAIDALNGIEPYKGGKGHDLWVLNELNNIDKHRLLVTVASSFQSLDLGAHIGTAIRKMGGSLHPGLPSLFIRPADNLCPLKVGDELFIDSPDAEVNQQMNFGFNIALSEPGVVDSKPLLETVQHLTDLVSGIVTGFRPCLA